MPNQPPVELMAERVCAFARSTSFCARAMSKPKMRISGSLVLGVVFAFLRDRSRSSDGGCTGGVHLARFVLLARFRQLGAAEQLLAR